MWFSGGAFFFQEEKFFLGQTELLILRKSPLVLLQTPSPPTWIAKDETLVFAAPALKAHIIASKKLFPGIHESAAPSRVYACFWGLRSEKNFVVARNG